MSTSGQGNPERAPAYDLDPSLPPSVFIPATQEQYLTWLEGYLMCGGQAHFIEEGDRSPETDEEILFAIEPFSLHGEDEGRGARKIIVADGIEWTGSAGGNTLFLFEDFKLIGRAPSVVATPRLADLGDSIMGSFIDDFKATIKVWSDPRIMYQDEDGIYRQHLYGAIDKYSRMAEVLRLEIDPQINGEILREAETERAEIFKTMGPDYQQRQMHAAFDAIRAATLY
jgi:hypothetical protein